MAKLHRVNIMPMTIPVNYIIETVRKYWIRNDEQPKEQFNFIMYHPGTNLLKFDVSLSPRPLEH